MIGSALGMTGWMVVTAVLSGWGGAGIALCAVTVGIVVAAVLVLWKSGDRVSQLIRQMWLIAAGFVSTAAFLFGAHWLGLSMLSRWPGGMAVSPLKFVWALALFPLVAVWHWFFHRLTNERGGGADGSSGPGVILADRSAAQHSRWKGWLGLILGVLGGAYATNVFVDLYANPTVIGDARIDPPFTTRFANWLFLHKRAAMVVGVFLVIGLKLLFQRGSRSGSESPFTAGNDVSAVRSRWQGWDVWVVVICVTIFGTMWLLQMSEAEHRRSLIFAPVDAPLETQKRTKPESIPNVPAINEAVHSQLPEKPDAKRLASFSPTLNPSPGDYVLSSFLAEPRHVALAEFAFVDERYSTASTISRLGFYLASPDGAVNVGDSVTWSIENVTEGEGAWLFRMKGGAGVPKFEAVARLGGKGKSFSDIPRVKGRPDNPEYGGDTTLDPATTKWVHVRPERSYFVSPSDWSAGEWHSLKLFEAQDNTGKVLGHIRLKLLVRPMLPDAKYPWKETPYFRNGDWTKDKELMTVIGETSEKAAPESAPMPIDAPLSGSVEGSPITSPATGGDDSPAGIAAAQKLGIAAATKDIQAGNFRILGYGSITQIVNSPSDEETGYRVQYVAGSFLGNPFRAECDAYNFAMREHHQKHKPTNEIKIGQSSNGFPTESTEIKSHIMKVISLQLKHQPDSDRDELTLELANATDHSYFLDEYKYEGAGLYSGSQIDPNKSFEPQSERLMHLAVPDFRDLVLWIHGRRMDVNRKRSRCVFTLLFDCAPPTDWTLRAPTEPGPGGLPIATSGKYAEIVNLYKGSQTELWPISIAGEDGWEHFVVAHPEKAKLRLGPFLRCNQSAKQAFEYRHEDKQAKWRDFE
jgi:hypothetical protein